MLQKLFFELLKFTKNNSKYLYKLRYSIITLNYFLYISASQKNTFTWEFDLENKLFIATDSVNLQKLNDLKQNRKIIRVSTNPFIFTGENSPIQEIYCTISCKM